MIKFQRRLAQSTILYSVLLTTSRGGATLLSDFMLSNASLQQGTTLFSNITASPNLIGVDPSNVEVQGFSLNGQDGLNFVFVGNAIDPNFQFLATTVGGGTHERAFQVEFDVTPTSDQSLLHGITQSAGCGNKPNESRRWLLPEQYSGLRPIESVPRFGSQCDVAAANVRSQWNEQRNAAV